jgi:hypothetical protein
MKRDNAAFRIPTLVLLALAGVAALPAAALSAEESQADREARRIEGEARRQQEIGRREMEDRDRAQAEALRGQEEAIRRMDATRSRIEASSQQMADKAAEQVRDYTYRYNAPGVLAPTPASAPVPVPVPALPVVPAHVDRMQPGNSFRGMNFVTLTERLGSYFGATSGVLVAGAGAGAPFGLQDGDVILSIDGRVPTDGEHVAAILGSYRPGERVKLRVQRDRKVITLDAMAPG